MPARLFMTRRVIVSGLLAILCLLVSDAGAPAQDLKYRTLSGVIITQKNEAVEGVVIVASFSSGETKTVSDADGNFKLSVPKEALTLRIEGKNIAPQERQIGINEPVENLNITIQFVIPPIHESLVITAHVLNPEIDRRNDAVYKDTLYNRDDQLLYTLDAGINVGQHEGGGKSVEIRRFGYNLDHGGVNGGLKVMVDDVQQNQGSQGHGQGYLGSLKSLTHELIDEVTILNGPFSADYGDFSGLGVVNIRLKEALPDPFTARIEGGSFNSFRSFLAYSPKLEHANAFIAYEPSYTDGPWLNPGRYRRDNLTGNYTWQIDETQALGFRLNMGRNDFYSSGQIPLDLVNSGQLDRFGYVDPNDGGNVRTLTAASLLSEGMEAGRHP